jgi:phosphate transport system protein
MDDQVDDMNRDAYTSLMSLMMNDPEAAPHALNALIICRNLERIADHATNIAEDVIFWVRGADIRHGVTVVLD